jgi:serine/threonine protein kinase
VLNISEGGVATSIETSIQLEPNSLANFIFIDFSRNEWEAAQVRVVWVKPGLSKNLCLAGLQFIHKFSKDASIRHAASRASWPQPADISFLTGTRLFRFLPRQAICPLLNCLSFKRVEQGKRLITQGEAGDNLYILQEGKCTASVERNGTIHTLARMRGGDVVGEIAVLTNETRSANVDADAELKIWDLNRKHFEVIAKKHPDLRLFLTEILTHRLETSKHTADRSIGKYLVRHKIGQGGYSIVYQGIHQILKLPVAVKMMKHTLALEEDFIENRNIVKVYDIEETYRTIFIIMEYMEGESLESLLKRIGSISIPQAVNLLIQVCSGLHYAHEKGLVHLDVKPGNIFVQTDGEIKILDFGLARPPNVEEGSIFEGTIYYLAPEQIECDAVDQRTDVYSLGITAYEMIVGRRPYPEGDLPALLKMHCNEDIPDPAEFVTELPEGLRMFILKACQRDPNQRYQDIGEVLEALRRLASDLGQEDTKIDSKIRKMTSLHLIYSDERQIALNRLLEEFSTKAKNLGIDIKAAEFKDI